MNLDPIAGVELADGLDGLPDGRADGPPIASAIRSATRERTAV